MRQMPERTCKNHIALAAIPGAFEPYAIRKNLRPGSATEQARAFDGILSHGTRRQIRHAGLHQAFDACPAPSCMHDETFFGEYAQGFTAFALHRTIEHGVQSAAHAFAGNASLLRGRLAPPRQTARITLLDHGKQRFPIAAQKGILQRGNLFSRHRLRIPKKIRAQHGRPPARGIPHRRNP